jgi:hypothetical protein
MMTTKNPIIDELHAVREKLLAEAGGTLDALVDRLQAEERKSDRPRFNPRQTTEPDAMDDRDSAANENQSSPTGSR